MMTQSVVKKKKKKAVAKTGAAPNQPTTNAKLNTDKTPKAEALTDTSHTLPGPIKERKIVTKGYGFTRSAKVELSEITATSKAVYVDDIHHANPTALQIIHWGIMPDTSHVVVRLSEDEYNYVVQKTGNRINHLISFIDCSVIPTLSYGSWHVNQIKGDFPSAKQIAEADAAFKDNPTMFHNLSVSLTIYEEEAKKKAAAPTEPTEDTELDPMDFLEMDDEAEPETDEEEEDWVV